jgi:hypothetical protein
VSRAKLHGHGFKAITAQRAELLFDRRYREAIDARRGFELHVPLNDIARAVEKRFTGPVGWIFKIENLKGGVVQAGPAATRQESTVDAREK